MHYAGNRSDSRHVVGIRDLVLCRPWHSLILDCVAFRDLEDSWIGFSAIKLCDLCAMMKKQRPGVVTKEILLPYRRAPKTVLM